MLKSRWRRQVKIVFLNLFYFILSIYSKMFKKKKELSGL